MSVGANIKKRRYELKMSQQELANAMGYKCRATISKIESGENEVTQSKLQRFAQVLDTTVEELILGSDSINTPISYSIESLSIDTSSRSKNIAIIMAGGKSSRNQQNIPNQFINVLGKPIIVYCMEAYQRHPAIDDIYIVCLKGWETIIKAYASQYHISKLHGLIPAGLCGILSVKNGLDYIKEQYSENDIIIFQESTRPMVSAEIISKLIQSCNSMGSASICQSMRDYLQFSVSQDKVAFVNRDTTVEVQSPESFKLGIIEAAFKKAEAKGHSFTESCCAMFMFNLGYYINFIEGSINNVKIIRQEDIAVFTALLKQQ